MLQIALRTWIILITIVYCQKLFQTFPSLSKRLQRKIKLFCCICGKILLLFLGFFLKSTKKIKLTNHDPQGQVLICNEHIQLDTILHKDTSSTSPESLQMQIINHLPNQPIKLESSIKKPQFISITQEFLYDFKAWIIYSKCINCISDSLIGHVI